MTEETKTDIQEEVKAEKPKKKKRSIFKLCLKIVGVLFLLLIIGIVVLTFTYDKIVSKAVSTVGSHLTGTEVKLEKFSLSILQGQVEIGGFSVANPEGYKTKHAVVVKRLFVDLDTSTILSNEIVIKEVSLSGVAISYEQGLTGNNLFDIKNHLEKMTASEKTKAEPAKPEEKEPVAEEGKPEKKVKVTVINYTDGSITVAAKSDLVPAVTVPMVDFSLSPEKSMTWAEFGAYMWEGLYKSVSETVASSANIAGDAGKKVLDTTKETGKGIIDGVKSLF